MSRHACHAQTLTNVVGMWSWQASDAQTGSLRKKGFSGETGVSVCLYVGARKEGLMGEDYLTASGEPVAALGQEQLPTVQLFTAPHSAAQRSWLSLRISKHDQSHQGGAQVAWKVLGNLKYKTKSIEKALLQQRRLQRCSIRCHRSLSAYINY